jgi:fumarate hydratase class I
MAKLEDGPGNSQKDQINEQKWPIGQLWGGTFSHAREGKTGGTHIEIKIKLLLDPLILRPSMKDSIPWKSLARVKTSVGCALTHFDANLTVRELMSLQESLIELIRRTSAEIPDDVHQAILQSLEREKKGTIAESALKIIERNIELAKNKSQPICQDTGSIIFYVDCPIGYDQITFEETAREAVKFATKKGFLRQNSVDSISGKNDGTNVGPGSPVVHFHQHRSPEVNVRLILKGGGCENVGAQYSLPNEKLKAGRDLDGCRKVILDAVLQAQGKGCGPGILGVCIGGDRSAGYEFSKQQFLRNLPDRNDNAELDGLEQDILKTANELGIGPMGFGGKTTLLGVKICAANRVPASFFVSVSYMCWAYRRQGVVLNGDASIQKWLY